MANDQRRLTGLRPYIQPYGNLQVRTFKADSSQAYYLYQPVVIGSNGNIVGASTAANVTWLGVIVGFMDTNRAGLPSVITKLDRGPYLTATETSNYYALVTTDPHQLYIAEEGTGGTALTAADIGQTVTMGDDGAGGSTSSGISAYVIQQSCLADSTQGNLQLVEVLDAVNSDGTPNAAGNGCKWVVRITRPQLSAMQKSTVV